MKNYTVTRTMEPDKAPKKIKRKWPWLVKFRYYKNLATGEQKKTVEILED